MYSSLMKMSTYKTFTHAGTKGATADTTLATVPSGFCAVVTTIFLKDGNNAVGALKVGANTVASTTWSNPFAFSGSTLYIGADGEDVVLSVTWTVGTLYYLIAGYMIPSADVHRITA